MGTVRAVFYILWGVTILCAIDAIRRPRFDWAAADRNRGWWISGLIVSSVLLLPAVVFTTGYIFGVLPALSSRSASSSDDFQRH